MNLIRRAQTVLRPPNKEVATADLSPATELDSLVRDFFTRLVKQKGPFVLDMEEPNTGFVHWEFVDFNGRTVVNLYHAETNDP